MNDYGAQGRQNRYESDGNVPLNRPKRDPKTPCIMCVQYIGGCSVHRGAFSTSGEYHDYIGGCSVHRRDTMSTSGDIMSTSGDVQYIGGIS